MKKFFNEFKAFIKRGSVIDMAVGVIIGAAFGKIVTSLVNDLLTPFIVLAVGKSSLTELVWTIKQAVFDDAGAIVQQAITVKWGSFLQTILDFLIIALVIFMIMNFIVKSKSASEKLGKKSKELIQNHINKENAEENVEQGSENDNAVEEEITSAVIEEVSIGEQSNIEKLLIEIRDSIKKE